MFDEVYSKNISGFTNLLAATQKQIVDLHDYLHRYFMDSFVMIAFGVELNSLTSNKPIPFADAFDHSQRVMFKRFFNPFFKFTEWFDPSIRRDIKILRQFAMDIIRQRKENMPRKNDLLQMFLDYEDEDGKLSETALCDQVLNFLFAGRDTTFIPIN